MGRRIWLQNCQQTRLCPRSGPLHPTSDGEFEGEHLIAGVLQHLPDGICLLGIGDGNADGHRSAATASCCSTGILLTLSYADFA